MTDAELIREDYARAFAAYVRDCQAWYDRNLKPPVPCFDGEQDLTSERLQGPRMGALSAQQRAVLPTAFVAAHDLYEEHVNHWHGGSRVFARTSCGTPTYAIYAHREGADTGDGYLEIYAADGALLGAARTAYDGSASFIPVEEVRAAALP